MKGSLIDGGDTDELIDDVEFSWVEDTWVMREELLSKSPYLSERVLKTVASNTVTFPHPVALEIFIANPDVLKNANFIQYLQTKADPMPQYMIELLLASRDNSTLRTMLNRNIMTANAVKVQYNSLFNRIWRANYQSNVLSIQGTMNLSTTKDYLALIDTKLSGGNFVEARNLYYEMPNTVEMTSRDLKNYNAYIDWVNLEIDQNDWRDADNITTGDWIILQELANTQWMYRSGQNAIAFLNKHAQSDDFIMAVRNSSFSRYQTAISDSELSKIQVYPNPAKTYINVELPSSKEGFTVEFFDLSGRVVVSKSTLASENFLTFNLSHLSNGVYLVRAVNKTNGDCSINVLKLLISVIKHFALIVFLLNSNALFSQTSFSQLFHNGSNSIFSGLVQVDEGFICTGGQVNLSQGLNFFGSVYKIDHQGNKTDSLFIGSVENQIETRIEVIDKFSDGSILAGFFKFDEIRKVLLVHFNQELEVLNTIEIESPVFESQDESSDFIDLSGLKIGDGDSVYLSFNLFNDERGNFLGVLKYSQSFEIVWEYYDWDAISNSVTDLFVDSLGVVVGENAINSPANTPTIAKLDDSGAIEWSFDFDIEQDLFPVPPRHIVVQGESVIVGTLARFEGMERSSPVLVSMDTEGNQEWITIVNPDPVDGSSIDALSKTCDNGFIAAARSTVPVIENDSLVASDIVEAQLIRFNTHGEILWKRNFRLIDNPTAEHEIRQVEQIADNGFVLVGEYFNTNINDTTNIFPYQRQLIIKTDACGCLVPNCDPECSRANCEDFPVFEDENFLLIGPSPTSGTLNVFVANVSSDMNHNLKLFSSSGALILEESNVVPDVTYIFDLSNVSPGIYFAQLLNNEGVVQTEKFVKF